MPSFEHIVRYDPVEDVIWVDGTGIKAESIETVDGVFDALEAVSARHPDRYAIICWKDVGVGSPEIVEHYTRRTLAWQKSVKGVVRYAANDPVVRAHIQAEARKHQKEGMCSNLYETRELALAAVRALKLVDSQRV